jgi:hypothetical protein
MGFCDEIQSPAVAILLANQVEKHGFIGFALLLCRHYLLSGWAFLWIDEGSLRQALTRYLRKG